jgi:transketolase
MLKKMQERLDNYPKHPSQRGEFGYQLYKAMAEDEKVWLVLGDLGYKQFDPHKEDFPERVVDCRASEQAALGVAVGLALRGKTPFVYSITNFVLYRPFEWVRNYLDHEKIPVKLVGAGRDLDYGDDGYTHTSEDAKDLLKLLPNITQFWPQSNEEVEQAVKEMLTNNKPSFLSVTRK